MNPSRPNRDSTLFRSFALLVALVLCIFQAPTFASADFPLSDGDRVLFIGDSITQDGRYVDLIQAYLWVEFPNRDITIVNAGLSSETVSGITEPIHPFPRPNINDRLQRALDLAKPDWVFVCYGMNDGIYHPVEPRIRDAYRGGLEQVLSTIHSYGAKTILLSPPVFDSESPTVVKRLEEAKPDEPFGYRKPFRQYDDTLVSLTNIAQSFENDVRVERYIDVHVSTHDFIVFAKRQNPKFVYGDGVHPPLEGHAAIARAILFGLGEDEEMIDDVLTKYTGLRSPEADPQGTTPSPNAAAIRDAVIKRGSVLSAAVRKLVDPKKGPSIEPGSTIPEFEQAMALAAEQAKPIQKRIQETKAAWPPGRFCVEGATSFSTARSVK
jgi:lysophospholipase L1-like esterase